jgi:hypothetical protein
MEARWTPPLEAVRTHGRCRLRLRGCAHGDGDTLQEAADALVARLLILAMACRNGSGFRPASELGPPDLRLLDFIYELSEIAATGGDIRERVFGFAADEGQAA